MHMITYVCMVCIYRIGVKVSVYIYIYYFFTHSISIFTENYRDALEHHQKNDVNKNNSSTMQD